MHYQSHRGHFFIALLLFFLISAFIFPNSTPVYAASTSTPKSTKSSISISAPASLELTITPSNSGETKLSTSELTISTTNTSGFHISLASNSQNANLVNNHHEEVISSIPSKTPINNLPVNTWGVYLGSSKPNSTSEFSPIPCDTTEFIHNEVSNASGTYQLAVGAKANTDLPAGRYYGQLVISVVADPPIITNLDDISYMQDITPEICANSELEKSYTLTDSRDNKTYKVAKLKDGNCWMIQNLAFDLVAGDTLSSADTDLGDTPSGSWMVPAGKTTETTIPTKTTPPANDTRSWNLGEVILTTPTPSTSQICDYVQPGQKIENICSIYYKNVATWNDTYTATAASTYDEATKSYDPSYLIGNYYQYNTATAGSGASTSSPTSARTNSNTLASAPGSICPKGWKLPKSGTNFGTSNLAPFLDINYSFYNLLKEYGYNGSWTKYGDYTSTMRIDSGTDFRKSPLAFTYSGDVAPSVGYVHDVGQGSDIWSSTAMADAGTTYAYSMHFDRANFTVSTRKNRHIGISVRCLAYGQAE